MLIMVLLPAVTTLTYTEVDITQRAREMRLMPILTPTDINLAMNCIAHYTL